MSQDSADVIVTDELIKYAQQQNVRYTANLYKLMVSFLVLTAGVPIIGSFLSYESNDIKIVKPALVHENKGVQYINPIINPSISYSYAGKIVEDYAVELLSFHFLKLNTEIPRRRRLFAPDEFERLYLQPLRDSGAFKRIADRNLVVTASLKRTPILRGVLVSDGFRTFKYSIPMLQTMIGPSGKSETNTVTLEVLLRQVERSVSINGLVIIELGIRK